MIEDSLKISRRDFLKFCAGLPFLINGVSRAEQPFDILINPWIEEAKRRRSKHFLEIPDSYNAVDEQLNQNRINFVLYGYGDTHEPPLSEKAEIGSFTILSLNTTRYNIDKISLTHDIWAPEISRFLKDRKPAKIYQAYHEGGFSLMSQVIEAATGLCADFNIVLRDDAIARLIDKTLDYITVDVQDSVDVLPYYLNGEKLGLEFPENHFEKGSERFSGARAIQYIKAVPLETGYNKDFEHRVRETAVLKSLRNSLRDNLVNPFFFPKLWQYVADEENTGAVNADFNLQKLLRENCSQLFSAAGAIIKNGTESLTFPEITSELYIVDAKSGDGAVQWVAINTIYNPLMKALFDPKIIDGKVVMKMGDPTLEVPASSPAGPYVDPLAENLVTDYWFPIRNKVREKLLGI